MTQSTIVRKSLNPFSRQTWVYGWYKIRTYRYQLADRVNADRAGSPDGFAGPWAWAAPTAGRKCTSFGWVGSATR